MSRYDRIEHKIALTRSLISKRRFLSRRISIVECQAIRAEIPLGQSRVASHHACKMALIGEAALLSDLCNR